MALKLVQGQRAGQTGQSAQRAQRRLQALRRYGRLGKLSPALAGAIVSAVGDGSTYESAAQACGVSARSLQRWRARGVEGEAHYSDLEAHILEASAAYRLRLERVVNRGALEDPRLAMEVLARRYPRDWGRPMVVAASVADASQAQALVEMPDWSLLSDQEKDEWTRITDKALGRESGYLVEGVMTDVDEDRAA